MAEESIIIRGDKATIKKPDGKLVTMSVVELLELAVPKVRGHGTDARPVAAAAHLEEPAIALPPGARSPQSRRDRAPA